MVPLLIAVFDFGLHRHVAVGKVAPEKALARVRNAIALGADVADAVVVRHETLLHVVGRRVVGGGAQAALDRPQPRNAAVRRAVRPRNRHGTRVRRHDGILPHPLRGVPRFRAVARAGIRHGPDGHRLFRCERLGGRAAHEPAPGVRRLDGGDFGDDFHEVRSGGVPRARVEAAMVDFHVVLDFGLRQHAVVYAEGVDDAYEGAGIAIAPRLPRAHGPPVGSNHAVRRTRIPP